MIALLVMNIVGWVIVAVVWPMSIVFSVPLVLANLAWLLGSAWKDSNQSD